MKIFNDTQNSMHSSSAIEQKSLEFFRCFNNEYKIICTSIFQVSTGKIYVLNKIKLYQFNQGVFSLYYISIVLIFLIIVTELNFIIIKLTFPSCRMNLMGETSLSSSSRCRSNSISAYACSIADTDLLALTFSIYEQSNNNDQYSHKVFFNAYIKYDLLHR